MSKSQIGQDYDGRFESFITETEVNRLIIKWHRDSGKMKAVKSVALPI